MLDYMIWPWFERMPMFAILTQGVINIPLNTFPNLVSFFTIKNLHKSQLVLIFFLILGKMGRKYEAG